MCPTGEPQARPKDWDDGWSDRLREAVQRAGFQSVTAFADTIPEASFTELAGRLDTRYAPVQLRAVLMQEAIDTGQLPRFGRRMLVEYIRRAMPKGWEEGSDPRFEKANAFSCWDVDFEPILGRSTVDQILSALEAAEPPLGWLPPGPDDELLVRAFPDRAAGSGS